MWVATFHVVKKCGNGNVKGWWNVALRCTNLQNALGCKRTTGRRDETSKGWMFFALIATLRRTWQLKENRGEASRCEGATVRSAFVGNVHINISHQSKSEGAVNVCGYTLQTKVKHADTGSTSFVFHKTKTDETLSCPEGSALCVTTNISVFLLTMRRRTRFASDCE